MKKKEGKGEPMKARSKLLALLLALAMVFSLAMPAFAADDEADTDQAVETVEGSDAGEEDPADDAEEPADDEGDPAEEPAEDEEEPGELAGTIIILHTNDVHGGIAGYAKVAALKKSYEEKDAFVLLVDAGDHIQGDPVVSVSEGATAIELMNLAGYDVSTLGNHEFDYGYENMKKLAEAADYPIVAANVLYEGKVAFEDNKTFETPDGVKIGVFGLDTPETATKAHPAKIKGVTFLAGEEMFDCAQEQVDALKADGCDYIICLGHLGIDDESKGNRSIDLLEEVTGIDLFIDGHSHSTMEQVAEAAGGSNLVGGTTITSTGTKLANIGVVTITKDGDSFKTEAACVATDTLDDADEAVAARADAIQKEIDDDYGAVFAKTEVELNGSRDPGNRTEETNLGDLICDALLWGAKQNGEDVDAAVTNGGGIRATIAAGDITKKDINTVLPFGNTLNIVKVTGAELLEALEASTYSTPTAVGGFPQVSSIEFTVDTTVDFDEGDAYPGSTYHGPNSINRVTIQTVGGEEFDEEAVYTIATNDFMAAGGDTYYSFSAASVNYDLGVPMDEVLMSYITDELDGVITVEAYGEPAGRITIKKAEAPAEPDPVESEPPATEEPGPVELQPEGTYTVVRGDNLSKIAKNQYGDTSKWRVIYEANKDIISNPNQIWPGQTLVIPAA